MNIISNFWKEIKKELGSWIRFKNYSDNPTQYKYIQNLKDVLNRLYFIGPEERAENNNYHSEKLGKYCLFYCKRYRKIN